MCEESMKYKPNDNRLRLFCAPSALRTGLLALLAALAAPELPALEDDSKQPMYIESDTATYDEKKGETVYTGRVKATQGSLEVSGDKMVVFQTKGKTERIAVWGNPARIKQTPSPGKEDNHGLGQRGEFFPETGIMILYEKAMTWEGPNPETSEHTVKSERIEYDTKNSIYKAGSAKSGGKRVHVTIQPKEDSGS